MNVTRDTHEGPFRRVRRSRANSSRVEEGGFFRRRKGSRKGWTVAGGLFKIVDAIEESFSSESFDDYSSFSIFSNFFPTLLISFSFEKI